MSDERDKAVADRAPTSEDAGAEAPLPNAAELVATDTLEASKTPEESETPQTKEALDEAASDADAAPEKSAGAPKVRGTEPEAPHAHPSYAFLAVTSAIALGLDLGTKAWAVGRLENPHTHRIVVFEDLNVLVGRLFFNLDLARNKGGAWGLFGDQPDYVRLPFFFLISAVAVVFVVSLYRRLEPRQAALRWALPLLLGGAIGNLVDRIRHQFVVDFLDVFIMRDGVPTHWPTFNVADVWIVVGVVLMAIDMFTPRKPVPAKSHPKIDEDAGAEA